MRTPLHDPGLSLETDNPRGLGNDAASVKLRRDDAAAAERRCILTGDHGERAALIRLALSPDGLLVPDIAARAPGRGAWIAVDQPMLVAAMAKGKLKGALARAFRGSPCTVPVDLPLAIDAAFCRLFLAQLGLAAKSGALLTGADKVDGAARAGQVRLLLHAADAAEDGRRKRDQSWRVGEDAEGSGRMGQILPVDRTALSIALGRDNAVHVAIIDDGWAERVATLLERWHRYAGWSTGAAIAASG